MRILKEIMLRSPPRQLTEWPVQDCQRYWTVGGVLRNVPPGSGRRKSRSTTSRDSRRQASNLTATIDTVGPASAHPALPSDLINSNPLASVLIGSLGLNCGDMGVRRQQLPHQQMLPVRPQPNAPPRLHIWMRPLLRSSVHARPCPYLVLARHHIASALEVKQEQW
jgi:hypothetical protein